MKPFILLHEVEFNESFPNGRLLSVDASQVILVNVSAYSGNTRVYINASLNSCLPSIIEVLETVEEVKVMLNSSLS